LLTNLAWSATGILLPVASGLIFQTGLTAARANFQAN